MKRIAFAALLALFIATPAVAAPQKAPPGWALVRDQKVDYFVFDSDMDKVVRRDLDSSRTVGSANEDRDNISHDGRVLGKGSQTTRTGQEKTLEKAADVRAVGRLLNTYQVWRLDDFEVTTSLTPYVDYRVDEFERRTKTTFSNVYALNTQYSWVDPYTGETFQHVTDQLLPPVMELSYSPWATQQRRTRIDAGTLKQIDTRIVASSRKDSLISSLLRVGAGLAAASGATRSGITDVFSSDAGRGAASSSRTSALASRGLSASAQAVASGLGSQSDFSALLAAAAGGPDLVDDGGHRYFKLGAAGSTLTFTPYDGTGDLRYDEAIGVDRLYVPANARSGRVHVRSFSVSPQGGVTLAGVFVAPLLGSRTATLRTI